MSLTDDLCLNKAAALGRPLLFSTTMVHRQAGIPVRCSKLHRSPRPCLQSQGQWIKILQHKVHETYTKCAWQRKRLYSSKKRRLMASCLIDAAPLLSSCTRVALLFINLPLCTIVRCFALQPVEWQVTEPSHRHAHRCQMDKQRSWDLRPPLWSFWQSSGITGILESSTSWPYGTEQNSQ